MANGEERSRRATTPRPAASSSCSPPTANASTASPPATASTYSVDFTDDEYRELYRDLVTVRRLDAEATALQRQGELGIWASLLGQEAAQVGSGRALREQDMAFPTYREHGVLYTRGIDPIMPFGLFRGVDQGGWDANKYKFNGYTIVIGSQTLHATGYAMGITMDGKTGSARRRGGDRVLRRRRHQPGRGQRGVRLGRRLQRPDRLLLPEQPVRDLRAAGTPDPHPALPPGRRLRLPRRADRRQRRAGQLRGDPRGARPRAQRPGPDADRGVHLSDGRAHQLGRPDPLPDRQRGRVVEGEGPDHPAPGVPRQAAARRRHVLRRGRRGGQDARPRPARAGAGHARPAAGHHVRPRLSARLAGGRRPAQAVRATTRPRSRGATH